ncbi:MAG TPA: tol-pal system protein YbgF [Dissulfurispiraceae bacterium]|nr:tol-pal system protein YbgF [Dissulfurispiraceae bacterium]
MFLTTEFTEERMRALKKIEKLRRVFSPKLCALCGLFLLSALLITGCASTGYVESIKSDAEIQRINDRKDMADLKTSVENLSSEIAALKGQSVTALKEGQSSLLSQLGDLSKQVQVLEGRFDENKYSLDKTIKDLLAEKDLQQARIAALENEVKELKAKVIAQAAPPAAAVPAPEGAAAPAEEQNKASSTTDYTIAQKLYDDAQIDFKGKHYVEAKQKFEKFTTDFPKHTLAPNAFFWIGESYYADKKYEDAILAYENFLKKYPSNDKAKGAMLKQAYSFIDIGDKKTGKVILERVIEKYPQSAEAELAEKKIAEILHSGKKKK